MKKIQFCVIALLLLAGLTTFTSCNKSNLIIKYNLSPMNVCLTANPYQGYQTFTFNVSAASVDSFLKAAGGTADLSRVATATVKGLTANVTTAGSDFSQIASVEVYLRAASNTTGVGDQVAYSQGLGAGVTQITMLLDGPNESALLSNDMVVTIKVLDVPSGNNAICMQLNQGYIELSVKQ